MDQLYRQTYFGPISIKDLKQKEKRRAKEDKIILEKNSITKTSRKEWCSMENQLESGCQGRIIQVAYHHVVLF